MTREELAALAAQVKAKVTVAEAAGWFGYTYSGRAKYPCPACEDLSKTREVLALYDDDARWHCFHCNVGGDVIDWFALRLSVRKGAAIEALADRLGIAADEAGFLDYIRSEVLTVRKQLTAGVEADRRARAVLREYEGWRRERRVVTPEWFAAWSRVLGVARSPRAKSESVELARNFAAMREAPPARRSAEHIANEADARRRAGLLTVLSPYREEARRRGWDHEDLAPLLIGACPKDDAGWFFRGRILFPVRDASGRVCGFGGRVLDPAIAHRPKAKYLNSPDSPWFHKSLLVYNLDRAAGSILTGSPAVVTEGYADVAACLRDEIPGAVAPCGSAMTRAQAELVSLAAREAVVMMDGDDAGRAAARRACAELAAVRVRVVLAKLPEGMDPDDVRREEGPGSLRAVIRRARANPADWRLDRAARELRAG